MRRTAAVAATVALLAGCVQPPDAGQPVPATVETQPPPTPTELDATDEAAAPTATPRAPDPPAASTSQDPKPRSASLRLRVTGHQLYGAVVGSGFAIDGYTVITNAHVVVGGDHVEMASWDGHDVQATVEEVAVRHDLAVLTTHQRLPGEPLDLATDRPHQGQEVTVVGYPDGGRVTVDSDARVIDTVDGSRYTDMLGEVVAPDRIVLIDADSVQPGSSGGPVLDASGALVGVVFALDPDSGDVLAVSVSTLRDWLDQS